MARALRICRTQLTHLCLLPLLGAVAFWLLIPVLFGTAMLDARAASQLLEGVFPLAGALLLVPLFAPERRPGLLDCVAARRASHLWVCGLRAAAMLGVLALLDAGLWLLMAAQGCAVSAAQLLAGVCQRAGAGRAGAFGLSPVRQRDRGRAGGSGLVYDGLFLRQLRGRFPVFAVPRAGRAQAFCFGGGAAAARGGFLGLLPAHAAVKRRGGRKRCRPPYRFSGAGGRAFPQKGKGAATGPFASCPGRL